MNECIGRTCCTMDDQDVVPSSDIVQRCVIVMIANVYGVWAAGEKIGKN